LTNVAAPFDLLVTGLVATGHYRGALIQHGGAFWKQGSSVLDFTGFAQEIGTVLSLFRIGTSPDAIHSGFAY